MTLRWLAMLAIIWAAASEAELRERQVEVAAVNPDPGETGGNQYYQNCLTRRDNGDLACGEVCFWRECVQCQNLCDCDPCDDCPDPEPDPVVDGRYGTGWGGGAAAFEWALESTGTRGVARVTGDGLAPDVWLGPAAPEQGVDYGFPGLDLGCPDDSQCPDLDCDCGGGDCRARCGNCTEWDWRFLGPVDSGRYPDGHLGGSGTGFNVYPVNPGGQGQGGRRDYWRRDSNAALFDMAANPHLMADYYMGVTSRCAGIYGDDLSGVRVEEGQEFVDSTDFSGFNNPNPYFWLHGLPPRTPLPARADIVATRDVGSAEVTPEPYAYRARVCETDLRDALETLAAGNANVGFVQIEQMVADAAAACGGGLWWPLVSVLKSASPGEVNECPNAATGYYVHANVGAGIKAGTVVVHWQADPNPLATTRTGYGLAWTSSVGGDNPDDFDVVLGAEPTAGPAPTPTRPPLAPLDRGACWLYSPEDGWRSIAAWKDFDPSNHSAYSNTDSDRDFNAHFLGFIDSRPAPYLVVERLTGTVGSAGFGHGIVPDWFNRAVLDMRWRVARNFVLEDCAAASRRFVTWTVDAGTPGALTAEVEVESCWAYYRGAELVAGAQFEDPHVVYELVTSPVLGTKRVPLRRFSTDPLTRSGVSAARESAVGDRTDARICDGSSRCLDSWVCPYYNHRGLLRSSFSLQTYPSAAGEGAGGVQTTGLEVCDRGGGNCRNFDTLLVYPGRMDGSGNDADLYHVMNSGDWGLEGNVLSYEVEETNGGVTEMVSVRRPWVGYRPLVSGGSLLLEYTDTLGYTTLHNPSLLGNCRPVCPYLEGGGVDRNSMELEFEGVNFAEHTVTLPGGAMAPVAEGCRYYGNGMVECGDFSRFRNSLNLPRGEELPYGRYRFAYDLPYPYCPALLASGRATMEDYVLPDWDLLAAPYAYSARGYEP